MRRATQIPPAAMQAIGISIHALHEESDVAYPKVHLIIFDISIHALHEESDFKALGLLPRYSISIHALHEESDLFTALILLDAWSISIHALHEESDSPANALKVPKSSFQSTLSMRRATWVRQTLPKRTQNFNPRSP